MNSYKRSHAHNLESTVFHLPGSSSSCIQNEFRRFDELNRAYREMFGFPFIIAVKEHSKDSILASFETRLGNSMDGEIEYALGQVFRITRLRLHGSIVDPPATPLDPS